MKNHRDLRSAGGGGSQLRHARRRRRTPAPNDGAWLTAKPVTKENKNITNFYIFIYFLFYFIILFILFSSVTEHSFPCLFHP